MRIKKIEISDEVADVLRKSSWTGEVMKLSGEQLGRKLYEATANALAALGMKWNRKLAGFACDAAMWGTLSAALDDGFVIDRKKTFEQFFTPPDLADRMARMLDLRGKHVLEPSAGAGHLIEAAQAQGVEFVTAVEMDDDLVPGLADLLDHNGGVWATDFMKWSPSAALPIDAVIMNPPFAGNKDIAHVRRAFDFLRPGGKLVAIMSPHFTFAEDQPSREFRGLIGYPERFRLGEQTGVEVGGVGDARAVSVERLPDGTFKAAGTSVSAVLVTIEKAAA